MVTPVQKNSLSLDYCSSLQTNGELITTLYRSKDDPRGGVWKFTQTGWQDITPKADRNYSAIAIDPNQPNRIFVVTYPMTPQGIYRSNDGGKTWISLKNNLAGLSWWPKWVSYGLVGGIALSSFDSSQVWLTAGIGILKTEKARQLLGTLLWIFMDKKMNFWADLAEQLIGIKGNKLPCVQRSQAALTITPPPRVLQP